MNFSNKRPYNTNKPLNTEGCCFFCLKNDFQNSENVKAKDDLNTGESENGKLFVQMRSLFRHLQIEEAVIFTEEDKAQTSFPKTVKAEEICVYLCESCTSVSSRFTNLFVQLQKIQIEMNHSLELIYQKILLSTSNYALLKEFSKRMTMKDDKGSIFSQLTLVENLRKEVANKSIQMQVGPIPCVKLNKTKVISVKVKQQVPKEEIHDKIEEEIGFEESCDNSPDSPAVSDRRSHSLAASSLGKPTTKTNLGPSSNHEISLANVNEVKRSPSSQEQYCRNSSAATNKNLSISVHPNHVSKKTGRYCCDLCDKTFKQPFNLKRHKQDTHLGIRFYCKYCNRVCKRKDKLRLHERICTNKIVINIKTETKLESKVEPDQPKLRFKMEANQTQDQLDSLIEDPYLDLVQARSPQPNTPEIKYAPEDSHLSETSSLPQTSKFNESRNKYTISKEFDHSRQAYVKKYHCKSCNKRFNRAEHVRRHYESIHLKRKYTCDICNVTKYARLEQLKKHKRICKGK